MPKSENEMDGLTRCRMTPPMLGSPTTDTTGTQPPEHFSAIHRAAFSLPAGFFSPRVHGQEDVLCVVGALVAQTTFVPHQMAIGRPLRLFPT